MTELPAYTPPPEAQPAFAPFDPPPFDPPPFAPPAEPPRRRRARLIVGGVVGLVVLLALAVGGTLWVTSRQSTDAAAAPTATATTAAAAPTVAPTTAPPVDLSAAILKKPTGAAAFGAPGWKDGLVTVADVAAIEYVDAVKGRSFLLNMGFVDGAVIGWSRTGERTTVSLYRFDAEQNASRWMHDAMQNLADQLDSSETLSDPLNGGTFFAIKRSTGANALYPSVTFLYKGPIVMKVFVATRVKADTHTTALDLLRRQFDRLA